jgi:hypothetical protein
MKDTLAAKLYVLLFWKSHSISVIKNKNGFFFFFCYVLGGMGVGGAEDLSMVWP